nr:MAG TPA: hypothetical protein [Caudoviricetes sp.]
MERKYNHHNNSVLYDKYSICAAQKAPLLL